MKENTVETDFKALLTEEKKLIVLILKLHISHSQKRPFLPSSILKQKSSLGAKYY